MHLILPPNVIGEIKQSLEDELNSKRPSQGLAALQTLMLKPELVRDPAIRTLVVRMLAHPYLGYRDRASCLLHEIGDPIGIQHLTYNALSVHPILKQDQTLCTGWGDQLVMRYADHLTEECIELLMSDMLRHPWHFHGEALANAPSEWVVPRLFPWLHKGGLGAAYASFILAVKGVVDARGILMQSVSSGHLHPIFAIIGLSHIPDDGFINWLREFSDPNHPFYSRPLERFSGVPEIAAQRLQFLTSREQGKGLEVIRQYYEQESAEVVCINHQANRLTAIPHRSLKMVFFQLRRPGFYAINSCADFLFHHASVGERNILATQQRENMVLLLDEIKFSMETMVRGTIIESISPLTRGIGGIDYLKDVTVRFEKGDYIDASTNWIINPIRHLVGTIPARVRGANIPDSDQVNY